MRVVALPSVYEIEHAKTHDPVKRRRKILIVSVVGAALFLAPAFFSHQLIIYCVSLASVWLLSVCFMTWITSARPISQGESGERTALGALLTLPDEYTAVTNCKIPGYEQIGDLDIVVIGPRGVVVIEVKSFYQHVIVDGDSWIAHGRGVPRVMRSVSKQLGNQVKALRSSLGKARIRHDIDGIIALNPTSVIEIQSQPSFKIVTYDNLAGELERSESARELLSQTEIDRVVQHLTGASS